MPDFSQSYLPSNVNKIYLKMPAKRYEPKRHTIKKYQKVNPNKSFGPFLGSFFFLFFFFLICLVKIVLWSVSN